MKKLTLLLLTLITSTTMNAQRMQQQLGRGVVAVQNGNNVTVTWRRLAQEPEDAKYKVYVRKSGAEEYVPLTSSPLSLTNYRTTTASLPVGSDVAVTIICDGKESALSTPFHITAQSLRNIYMEISFDKSPLKASNYSTKFCWPCDLDGDGEYDYVVDRNPVDGTLNHFVEGYLADGTHLWTVDLGPNELSSTGQDDQICAYDIDCDGYGEVIVQTSDGTRFWDKTNNTFGLYVGGSTSADTDGDGIVDYNSQSTRNAPQYMSVVNGMTGAEKAYVEQQYDAAYNRTNKAALMGDEYNKHVGHVGVFYHDGIHPAVVMEWHTRTTAGTHQYRNSAFAFNFADGKATDWHQLFMEPTGGQTFHQIRIADVDGDGCDEMIEGAYTMDNDGKTLFNTGIAHGDRHRTSDIDPERPGMETFAILQNAPDMLGQILYDATDGTPIKKWYLPAVGDVGRGECLDLDPSHLGWEMFSTMNSYQLYDAHGDAIEGKFGYFPTEGIWWDGALDRERVDTPDGNGENAMIVDYTSGRLIEMAKESSWTLKSINGKRGLFWGDIMGDWREELILNRVVNGVNTGIVGFTTDISTSISNIYCLQEDPHYRGDCTTKGYYQSPDPGFYLGYDMPRPPLPPCMKADDETDVYGIADGDATVSLREGVKKVYAMPVKGQTLRCESVPEGAELWKSQQGTLVIKGNESSAKTVVSEGILQLDGGEIKGTLDLRARGTITGNGMFNDVILEGALNYEGCRIMPTDVMFFKKGLNIDKKTYIEISEPLSGGISYVVVYGGLQIAKPLVFTINQTLVPGDYTLVTYDKPLPAEALANVSLRGLQGVAYDIVEVEDIPTCMDCPSVYRLVLVVRNQRQPSEEVVWTGAETDTWEYKYNNFSVDGESTSFVAGDGLVFNDEAVNTTITVYEQMPASSVTFDNSKKNYVLQGLGGISGNATLTKNGSGTLTLNATASDYTGKTVINSGKVIVKTLGDAGNPSPLGAAGAASENIEIGKAVLEVTSSSAATDRGMLLTDTATISIPSGITAIKGLVKGKGTLLKTGNGQLNITYSGNNSWAGTILQAGTLAMGAWNTTFGTSTSPINVTGNATIRMFDNNTTSAVPDFQNSVTVAKGKMLSFYAGSRCKVRGTLKGEGTVKISFPYVRGDVYTNVSNFEGTYQVTSENCRFVQAMDFSKATLKLDAGAAVFGAKAGGSGEVSYNHKVGALAASADATIGTGVWNVGYLSTNTTYAGKFTSSATLNKYGDGTLTLTGSSQAPMNIYAGKVMFNNTSASTTTGLVTVKSGGIASGSGNLASVKVENGGVLATMKTTVLTSGLTINGSLTMQQGSVLEVRTRMSATSTKCDTYTVSGNIQLVSPTIRMSILSGEYAGDEAFRVFPGSGSIILSGDVTMEPRIPMEGYEWDLSTFATDGTIRIAASADGIRTISAEQSAPAYYDAVGRKVNTPSQHGLYINNGKKVIK